MTRVNPFPSTWVYAAGLLFRAMLEGQGATFATNVLNLFIPVQNENVLLTATCPVRILEVIRAKKTRRWERKQVGHARSKNA